MINLTQRLARNDFSWRRPSPLRLGRKGEGEYVQEYGFGCEDWNFNSELTIDGFVYGYSYYRPSIQKRNQQFNFSFVTWESGRWFLVGFYCGATFVEDGAPPSLEVTRKKAQNLRDLSGSLGGGFRKLSDKSLERRVNSELQAACCWKVSVENVVGLASPLLLPESVFESTHYRITTPRQISAEEFSTLRNYAETHASTGIDEGNAEAAFSEGRVKTAVHLRRERNPLLVREAKRMFIAKHGRLYCEACGFDFAELYGERGSNFIEAHHTVPLSKLDGTGRTKVSQLAMLCSNCHRMIHHQEPWLEVAVLRDLIESRRLGEHGG